MGFLDKVKAGAEQAATKAREGIEDVQTKRELGQAFDELGHKAFELLEAGEIEHASLAPLATRVRELKTKLEEGAAAEGSTAGTQPA